MSVSVCVCVYFHVQVCVLVCIPESRCILLPVVLRLLQAHMQEQRDLVMCVRILTSMLSLIRKYDSVATVSTATAEHRG